MRASDRESRRKRLVNTIDRELDEDPDNGSRTLGDLPSKPLQAYREPPADESIAESAHEVST